MRQIGTVAEEAMAHRFVSYLSSQGIDALTEQDSGQWAIWVREEDHRQRALEEFRSFLADPNHPRYRESLGGASDPRRRDRSPSHTVLPVLRPLRTRAVRLHGESVPVTWVLAVLPVVITLLGYFGQFPRDSLGGAVYRELEFADPGLTGTQSASGSQSGGLEAFVSIRKGEVWRLVTPIFLHFNVPHLIFNVWMFYYFAGQIERLRGPIYLALLVLATAITGNIAQAYFVGPAFGGMSGVVYGLLGYVWIKSILEPDAGFRLDNLTLVIAVGWFFLCAFEIIPNVANHGHAGGLAAGILFALASSRGSTTQ
jgi:GlpG protein